MCDKTIFCVLTILKLLIKSYTQNARKKIGRETKTNTRNQNGNKKRSSQFAFDFFDINPFVPQHMLKLYCFMYISSNTLCLCMSVFVCV